MKSRQSATGSNVGRVVASHGRDALVADAAGGRLRCRLRSRRLAVVCGDRVRWIAEHTEGAAGLITEVLPRTSLLSRLSQRGDSEPVAANLTQLAVVVAPVPAPDFGLCDRYLAAAEWAGLKACIVANKCDLGDGHAVLAAALGEFAELGYPVVPASKRIAGGGDALAAQLAAETSVLVGQSGAGKSSLTNLLVPGVDAVIAELSQDGRSGRHTTTCAALASLPGGGELIDSPGVRDFAPPLPPPRDVAGGFREIAALAPHCRFKDCRHGREPGCAVAAAAGGIAARRIASYRRLLQQAEEMARREPRLRR
ncbi:MAG: ribosome small subunit-dependent GTPase A [Steroidobacteraceae bacterium]